MSPKTTSRRDFLKLAGLGAVGVGLGACSSEGHPVVFAREDAVGMLYDATKCVGCKACVASCKRINNMDAVQAPFDENHLWDAPIELDSRTRTIIKLYKEDEDTWSFVKRQCMHCAKPGCVSACPVAAMRQDERGIVYYDKSVCIGCRYCQIACPFTIPKFEWDKTFPKIVKCDLCYFTNLKQGKQPGCVEACPAGAVIYGTRKELLADAKARIKADPERYNPKVYGEFEVGGTNCLYLAASDIRFADLTLKDMPAESGAALSENIQHTIYKGFIAPVALYTFLTVVALKNQREKQNGENGDAPAKKED